MSSIFDRLDPAAVEEAFHYRNEEQERRVREALIEEGADLDGVRAIPPDVAAAVADRMSTGEFDLPLVISTRPPRHRKPTPREVQRMSHAEAEYLGLTPDQVTAYKTGDPRRIIDADREAHHAAIRRRMEEK